MKSIKSFRPVVSAIFLVGVVRTMACGPFPPIIPTPEFFRLSRPCKSMADYERDENLRLWQMQTSCRIPLADIERVVYHDSSDTLADIRYAPSFVSSNNLFYAYLKNTNDMEACELLCDAKSVEEKMKELSSPWHYPNDRDNDFVLQKFSDVVAKSRSYRHERMKYRYGLQAVRVLFASRQYTDCIGHFDTVFSKVPDSNLMKRMAKRYIAGCWSRLGFKQRADSIFAEIGDIWSLSDKNPVAFMALHNPAAPQTIEYIRSRASDTVFMLKVAPVAESLLKNVKVKDRGDWEFLLAYYNNEYCSNVPLARKYIYRSLRHKFSSEELQCLARAYKMKLDAKAGHRQSLLSDLKWIERKADALATDADRWIRVVRNVIYVDLIPRLWQNRDYTTAILLCAYADNFDLDRKWYYASRLDSRYYTDDFSFLSIDDLRKSERYRNEYDYSCLSFQLMGSLSSSQMIKTYGEMMGSTPLYKFLRKKVRTDSDYYYELIGTLALREENYARAVTYLSRVGRQYQKTMNIYKAGWLARAPFVNYPSRWGADLCWYDESDVYEYEICQGNKCMSQTDAKLNFAVKMRSLQYKMKHGRTADERGIARLKYSIGRRNSFEECWALTQYWRGCVGGRFQPDLEYWDNDFADANYNFLYDYVRTVGHRSVEERYANEVSDALAMLVTDAARAEAEYILGNLKTVIKRYGNTPTASNIKASCDNWRTWL